MMKSQASCTEAKTSVNGLSLFDLFCIMPPAAVAIRLGLSSAFPILLSADGEAFVFLRNLAHRILVVAVIKVTCQKPRFLSPYLPICGIH
jgi:hypothetical protein